MFLEDFSSNVGQFDGLMQLNSMHQQTATKNAIQRSAAENAAATNKLKMSQDKTNDLLSQQIELQRQQQAAQEERQAAQEQQQRELQEQQAMEQKGAVEFRKLLTMASTMLEKFEV